MMIKVLAENTAVSEEYKAEHGLSLYIQTGEHKILFDVGESDIFLQNAKKLDADIGGIDFVVLSHSHVDHGGGLKAFLKENVKAPIYLHPEAFGNYYSQQPNGRVYIGLDRDLINNERIIFTAERFFIGKGIELFSSIPGKELLPSSNQTLMMEKNGEFVADTFEHEQNLIIQEAGKVFLFAGCAHNGIVNIVNHFNEIKKRKADYVFGGFHLYNHSAKKSEDAARVQQIGEVLKNTNTKYYTCHCTGLDPYNELKKVIGDRIGYLATGSVLEI